LSYVERPVDKQEASILMPHTPGSIELTLRQRLRDAHLSTAIGRAPEPVDFTSFSGADLGEFILTVMNTTEEAVLQLAVEVDTLRATLGIQ
jgi:hypothetical protein